MAKIINTAEIDETSSFAPNEASWIYNGLDCCVTYEIRNELRSQMDTEMPEVQALYAETLNKQAPVMEMCLRGLRVDIRKRDELVKEYKVLTDFLETNLSRICEEGLDCSLNWRSHVQIKNLLYGVMGLKPVKARNADGVWAPAVNREALEKLQMYIHAQPIALHILALRDLQKKISFLETKIDKDGRMRTSLNMAGTNTGRLASSESAFGTGNNLQNVARNMRETFVADPGYLLVNVDLEQADARNVGILIYMITGDSTYLDACESGDLHTTVCRMAWPHLDWPEDRKGWRAVADQIAYRELSYRDLSKKLGHGTNYYGTPRTMAMHTKTDRALIESFQTAYFKAFPGIQEYHRWIAEQLKTVGYITTPYGRRRYFFGRAKEDSTLREAIAYAPQSMTAAQIDAGYHNLWREMPEAQLLIQVHDSILFQVPLHNHAAHVNRALELLKFEREIAGRKFSVPLEAKVGFNWGDRIEDKKTGKITNEYGLMKWTGEEKRVPPTFSSQRKLKNFL